MKASRLIVLREKTRFFYGRNRPSWCKISDKMHQPQRTLERELQIALYFVTAPALPLITVLYYCHQYMKSPQFIGIDTLPDSLHGIQRFGLYPPPNTLPRKTFWQQYKDI